MTKPKPANPALSIFHPDLASALAQIGAEVDHQPLRSSALARIMHETFHVKWSGKFRQRAKMYPALTTGYGNDNETQFFGQV